MKHLTTILLVLRFLLTRLQAAEEPNVLLILAADLGWSDTTPYGTTALCRTQNIERLARRGTARQGRFIIQE